MGQKVNPVGFRVGVMRDWESQWYADKNFGQLLQADIKLREYIRGRLKQAGVSRVLIERPASKVIVTVYSSRPGVVIGKKGADIEGLRRDLQGRCGGGEVQVNIVEVRRPEAEAQLVAENIAFQLERRVAFRRAMKRAVEGALRMGAKGVRVSCGGRLGGNEIARTEWYREGRVPLHTLRADVDYGFTEAHTTYGVIGVKVWVFKGEKLGDATATAVEAA